MDMKDFILCLKKIDTKTPLTINFDTVQDENGRIYGQEKNRWWDNLENYEGISSQKHHVLGHFLCWYYQGAPSNCTKDNSKCKECYSETLKEMDLTDSAGNSGEYRVSEIYNRMGKPEMYIYIAEALGILKEKELENFVKKIKDAIDNNESWKKVKNEELPWDLVEEKVRSILEEE